jgi:hypothetical protein
MNGLMLFLEWVTLCLDVAFAPWGCLLHGDVDVKCPQAGVNLGEVHPGDTGHLHPLREPWTEIGDGEPWKLVLEWEITFQVRHNV